MFKKWDKVRCIESFSDFNQYVWDIYKVIEIWDETYIILEGNEWISNSRRFELVKEEQREPKTGDIIDASSDWENWKEQVYLFTRKDWIYWVVHEEWYNCIDWVLTIALVKHIRPIQPKDTLQSVYKEIVDDVSKRTSPKFDKLKDKIKRMEPFIPAQ